MKLISTIILTCQLLTLHGQLEALFDIKKFRQEIINEKLGKNLQKVFNTRDFYSLSMVRDLFFHVQELRFTIPQISKIINDFNLEFLGFYNKDSYKRGDKTSKIATILCFIRNDKYCVNNSIHSQGQVYVFWHQKH